MNGLYPKLDFLEQQRRELDKTIHDTMERTFLGKRVRVNHHRGSYTGTVTQVYRRSGFSVIVRNDATGKATERYPLCRNIHGMPAVELLDGGEE